MDKILQAIHDELVLSYTQAGRVVPTTVAIVAAALMDALKFSDVEEVHESFKKARMMADVPTQRVLNDALNNYRAEHRAYMHKVSNAPRLSHQGSKQAANDEIKYMMALKGIGFSKEDAAAYIKEFESNPDNKDFVDYERGYFQKTVQEFLKR